MAKIEKDSKGAAIKKKAAPLVVGKKKMKVAITNGKKK